MLLYAKQLLSVLVLFSFFVPEAYTKQDQFINQPRPFIVGGVSADPGEFPEFAILLIYQPGAERAGRCSATMIAPNKVLTAAHCIEIPAEGSRFTVIPAYYDQSLDGQNDLEIAVVQTQLHPDYGPNLYTYEADIAVLTLERSVSSKVAPVLVSGDPLEGEAVTILGIGLTDFEARQLPDELQKYRTVIPSNESCNNDEIVGTFYEPYHICVSPRFADAVTCFGDSGGPILVRAGGRRVVAGIASSLDEFDCNPDFTFAVYTRVSSYTDFIRRHSPETRFIRMGTPPPITSTFIELLLSSE